MLSLKGACQADCRSLLLRPSGEPGAGVMSAFSPGVSSQPSCDQSFWESSWDLFSWVEFILTPLLLEEHVLVSVTACIPSEKERDPEKTREGLLTPLCLSVHTAGPQSLPLSVNLGGIYTCF